MTETSVTSDFNENQTPANTTASEVVQAPSEIPKQEIAEKLVPQSTVDKVVGRAKAEAYERAKAEFNRSAEAAQTTQQQPQQSIGGMKQASDESIREMIRQESEKVRQEEANRLYNEQNLHTATEIANSFHSRLDAGKGLYSDFEEVVSRLPLTETPEALRIIPLLNKVDNTADVLYELAKNPRKFIEVVQLNHLNPHYALQELNNMSAAIRQNQTASQQKQPREPLSQLNSSPTGIDSGEMTVADYKKVPWLRG